VDDVKNHEKALKEQVKLYKELKKVGNSDELKTYFDLLLKTAADKMVWSFVGENIKDWNDFCRVRGEIVAYLFPLQEVRGADVMVKHLTEQLNEYYKS